MEDFDHWSILVDSGSIVHCSCCVVDTDNILLPTFIQSSPQILKTVHWSA